MLIVKVQAALASSVPEFAGASSLIYDKDGTFFWEGIDAAVLERMHGRSGPVFFHADLLPEDRGVFLGREVEPQGW